MSIDMTVQPMTWDEAYRIPRMTAAEAKASWDAEAREQERQAQAQAVRAALIEGEESGAPQPFDVQAFKARMAAAVHG